MDDGGGRPLLPPAALVGVFAALQADGGAPLLKYCRKTSCARLTPFTLRIPSLPSFAAAGGEGDSDEDDEPGQQQQGRRQSRISAEACDAVLSWQRKKSGGALPQWPRGLQRAGGDGRRMLRLLNLRAVTSVEIWETPLANVLPGE